MKYLHALNTINGVGSQKMRLLMESFGNGEAIWKAGRKELAASGVGESLAEKIDAAKNRFDVEKEWSALKKEAISVLSFDSDLYPPLLKEIHNPPYILYIRGEDNFVSRPLLAIVGSRKLTRYGEQAAHRLAFDLAAAGITVVSGLALGIDAMAHRGALDARGITVAVLGSGADKKSVMPPNNASLAERIVAEKGTLVSEFPPGSPGSIGNFPARNRIMAGMTLGTVVVEAAEKSGSLITAGLALEFNREVFAVPGSIFSPQSTGTHNLIQKGAKLVKSAKDILEELRLEERAVRKETQTVFPLSSEEQKLADILSPDPLHIDTIAKLSKLETSRVSSALVMLEMKGAVKNIGGQNYIRL